MEERFLNPQQEAFLAAYVNPKSDTFANALQSALKAGYSQEYAENITHLMPDWLSESIGDLKRLRKAENVLDETLDMPIVVGQIVIDRSHSEDDEDEDEDDGPRYHEVTRTDPALIRIKQDSAKFVASTLGKDKYSTRKELTGAGGQDLFRPDDETKERVDKVLEELNG